MSFLSPATLKSRASCLMLVCDGFWLDSSDNYNVLLCNIDADRIVQKTEMSAQMQYSDIL